MMKSSIQLGKILDIPIRLHISFLLVLPLFTYLFAVEEVPSGEWMSLHTFGLMNTPLAFGSVENLLTKYVFGALATVMLFSCVLLHELGHSYVAKKHGIVIRSITLIIFGGIASMEEIPSDPKIESKIAIAGPSVSLAIGAGLYIVYRLLEFVRFREVTILVGMLAFYNVLLCGFNLLPAFPMDGGRVLRSWLAKRMSYMAATKRAVSIGKIFAIMMGVFGFLSLDIWLVLIAFFIYIGASEEERATEVTVTLKGVKVKDIMTRNVASVPSTMTVSELVGLMFKEKHMGYAVADNGLKGVVTFSDVQRVPYMQRDTTRVGDIMTRSVLSVAPDDDALKALKIISQKKVGRVLVVENGAIAGIISKTDLIRSIQLLQERRGAYDG